MTEAISVHDNILLGYEVDSTERRIVLHTEYSHDERKERSDVIFEGVLSYHFEGDLFSSIVFDIEETMLKDALDPFEGLLARREKQGWPQGWEPKSETLDEYLSRNELKVYGIQSSYGLDGFVFAESMKKLRVD
ncbi:MAG: hypothetical protein AAGA96_17170 [Verrucomicrobiota bacterium]